MVSEGSFLSTLLFAVYFLLLLGAEMITIRLKNMHNTFKIAPVQMSLT
jgi:hypothetical protein